MPPSNTVSAMRFFRGVTIIHMQSLVGQRGAVDAHKDAFYKAIEKSDVEPRLILDMHEVDKVSSKVLGLILALNLRVIKQGGRLRVCNLEADIDLAFALLKLEKILRIDETLEEAQERIHIKDNREYDDADDWL